MRDTATCAAPHDLFNAISRSFHDGAVSVPAPQSRDQEPSMTASRLAIAITLLGAAGCVDAPTAGEPVRGGQIALTATDPTAVAAVGRMIFFDVRLSANQNQSCASCHDPTSGWTGPISAINAAGAVYEGSIAGRFGNRKPPSSAYATLSPVFHFAVDKKDALFVGGNFWDGRATGQHLGNPAADQALGPFLNPLEQALATPGDVVSRICAGPYGSQFIAIWGADICEPARTLEAFDAVGRSVAAFEGSRESNAFTSKFDLAEAGQARFTPDEQLGLALFKGKAKCSACHTLDGGPSGEALFTDFTFDNIGVPKNPDNPFYGMAEFNPAGAAWLDPGLGGFLETRPEFQALAAANLGKQKVPTLRNVDLRPSSDFVKAYGHNGYFKTLAGIVHFYNTRDVKPTCPGPFTEAQALAAACWPAPEIATNVNRDELGNLHLTGRQEQAIVAFLRTLSDGYRR
jgi:cytochrome c peroxidase